MVQEDVLDLGAVDLVAGAVDHVLLAVEDAQEALAVERADIAGMPEPVAELGPVGIWPVGIRPVPIARHHHRPLDPDLVGLARSDVASMIIDDGGAGLLEPAGCRPAR